MADEPKTKLRLEIAHVLFIDIVDDAIAALPHLLEVPNGLTPGILRLDPYWDPLRKDPRFQKLCQEPNK